MKKKHSKKWEGIYSRNGKFYPMSELLEKIRTEFCC